MSRRCRQSLLSGGGRSSSLSGDLSSGCDCSRLAGGEPTPCTHVLSPGFLSLDQHVALYGRGLTDVELPLDTERKFDGSDKILTPAYALADPEPKYSDSPAYIIEVLDTDPPLGSTYHFFIQGGAFSGLSNINFDLVTDEACIPIDDVPYTSQASTGDLVTIQFAHKASSTSGTPGTQVIIAPIDTETRASTYQKVFPCTTSYVIETFSVFLNREDTRAVSVSFLHNGSLVPSWFLGGVIFSLTSGAGGVLLCAQSGLITIDNSTTETAFL